MLYTFEDYFGRDGYASFDLDLSDEEVAYIKRYLEENGDCDYAYMETDENRIPGLFDKINDAANDAVLKAINERRKEDYEKGELFDDDDNPVNEYRDLEMEDVNWGYMSFTFCWPKELLPHNLK